MTLARLGPAFALGMLPLLAQTNAVKVDQVVTLQASLSSLNEPVPVFTTPTGTTGTSTATISTGTATITIRFIGGNSTNVNPVTGTPLPLTGTTTNVSSATVSVSFTSNLINNETITSAQILRAPGSTTGLPTGSGTTATAVVFDLGLPASTAVNSGQQTIPLNNQVTVTNAAQLAALREIVNNPSGFYLNVKTQSTPNGLLAGQLRRTGDTASDTTNTRLDLVTRLIVRIAYQEGVITLAERDAYLSTLPVTVTPGTTSGN